MEKGEVASEVLMILKNRIIKRDGSLWSKSRMFQLVILELDQTEVMARCKVRI